MMETYYGAVRSPADAIKLFEACRLGLLPRVQRRLSEKERQAIRSGSVFVWDEREAGMRRWTDGKSWSASRVSGSFLTYREMEGKRGNAFGSSRRGAGKTPDSGRGSDEDQDDGEPDGYRYKPDGLTKQSFSITNSAGQHLHLIAYYSRGPLDLLQPSNDPALRHIVPAKGMYPESSLTETASPAATRAPMHQPHYAHHPPPHHHGYPPHYAHPGYQWPPSPVTTPPYSHAHYPYSQGPPPPGLHAYSPHPHHQHHPYPPPGPNHMYERAPLPQPHAHAHPHPHPHPQPQPHQHQHHHQPQHQHQQPQHQNQHQHSPQHPHPQLPAPRPPKAGMPLPQPYPHNQRHSPQIPPPRLSLPDSPRSQYLQAQAREAVQIEPRLAPIDAARNQHSPLLTPHPNGTATTAPPLPPPGIATSPSVRAPSGSPPASAISRDSGSRTADNLTSTPTAASTRPSLSALLLHPPTIGAAGSEPNSANPVSAVTPASAVAAANGLGSAGSSPGAAGNPSPNALAAAAAAAARVGAEDARAIGVLNKNFF